MRRTSQEWVPVIDSPHRGTDDFLIEPFCGRCRWEPAGEIRDPAPRQGSEFFSASDNPISDPRLSAFIRGKIFGFTDGPIAR